MPCGRLAAGCRLNSIMAARAISAPRRSPSPVPTSTSMPRRYRCRSRRAQTCRNHQRQPKSCRPHLYRESQCGLYQIKGSSTEYKAGLERAVAKGWLRLHESGTYVWLTAIDARKQRDRRGAAEENLSVHRRGFPRQSGWRGLPAPILRCYWSVSVAVLGRHGGTV